MLWASEPIDHVLADAETPAETRSLLRLVPSVRDFASELGLKVGDQYTSYVDWPEDRIVTTLVRTRPPGIEAIPYWFPLIGELPYKGYFDRARAEAEAERLREVEAFDVCVSGVTAYSTLGWLNDPVTSPMLRRGAASLVETLLHELVHATAFVPGDAHFNESVAQFIGQEATIRFFSLDPPSDLRMNASPLPQLLWPDAEHVRLSIEDRRLIARATMAFRDRLVAMSDSGTVADSGLRDESFGDEAKAATRREIVEREARAELAALPLRVIDPEKVAAGARLSNACLALRGSYTRDLPRHAKVLDELGGDLNTMITRLKRVADEEILPREFYEIGGDSSVSDDGNENDGDDGSE